ncbi:MAG TPA: hypothetical protein VKE51_25340 [Vicinamibacterales bacterium]|nr:hypothetical protein [Vicinamibacterales bacterium]
MPASRVLSAWSAHDWRDGIHVGDLAALEALVVTTENSTYEIVLLASDTARVLVRGGAFFPVFTPARLAGSSLGGAFLKLHSIHVGFRLEFGTENGFIITSPVRSVVRAPEQTNPADLM